MANSKDELREKLAQDMAEFRGGGQVCGHSAPERRPWKRRPSLTDEAYQQALLDAEQQANRS